MFDALIEKWRIGQQVKAALKNPIIAVAREAVLSSWVNNPAVTADFTGEFIQKQAEDMIGRAAEVAQAQNPALKNRDLLLGVMQECAIYEAVVLSNPKTEDVSHFRTLPGVSAALWEHLPLIAERFDVMRQMLQGLPEKPTTPSDIHDVCLYRYRICWAHMTVNNLLRAPLQDRHLNPELDWFKPCYCAIIIWEEGCIRLAADLPQLIEPLEAIQYNALIEMATEGVEYPNLEWEHRFGKKLPVPKM